MSNKNKNLTKKKIKYARIITLFCLVILVMELSFMIYKVFYIKKDKTYFDTINNIVKITDGYISIGGNNDNEKLYEKAKITKYDKKKEKVFEKLYNKGLSSTFNSVCATSDSFIAVGNYTKNEKDYTKDYTKGLIVKYDTKGNIIWEKDFTDAPKTTFNKIKEVSDGYIVVGESLFEKENKSLIGGAYLIKYDKNGKILWKQRYGNNSLARFNDFIVVEDKIFVVGKNNENLGTLITFDITGNILKEETYENIDSLGFTSLIVSENNLFLVGAKNNKGLLVKYDLDTNLKKAKEYNLKTTNRFNKIILDTNNDLVIIGISYNEKNSNHNGIITKYNKDLELIEDVIYDTESDDYFTDIILEDKNYLVTGYSLYEDTYLTKFTLYSNALKELGINQWK